MVASRQPLIPGSGPSTSRFGRLLAARGVFPSITTSNLRFYRGLRGAVINIDREVLPAILSAFPNDSYRLDHFYLASDSPASYAQFKDRIMVSGGKLLREVNFKGRHLAVLRLPKPLIIDEYSAVDTVELGEPKPGRPEQNNVAHIAYSITGFDRKEVFQAILDIIESRCAIDPAGFGEIRFIQRDIWGDPPQLVGFKFSVRKGDKVYQVEIRKAPLV